MSFVAIVTDSKSEDELKKMINKDLFYDVRIIFIKEKNLSNIKNIKLEVLVINTKVNDKDIVEKIINNSKNLIINADLNNIEVFKYNLDNVLTYGFNSKSDITVSSREEERQLLYLQKSIKSIYEKNVEMQEISANIPFKVNIYNIMIIVALSLFYAK